jgi:hypothetical protein
MVPIGLGLTGRGRGGKGELGGERGRQEVRKEEKEEGLEREKKAYCRGGDMVTVWDERNTASFQHSEGPCCFAAISGPDAARAYGLEAIQVVGYGSRLWPSFGLWLVPQATGAIRPTVC